MFRFVVWLRTYQHLCNADDKRATQAINVTNITSYEEYYTTEFYKIQASGINLLVPEIFFLILAQPVYKM